MDIKEMVPYTQILIILPVGSTSLLYKNDVKIIANACPFNIGLNSACYLL